MKNLLQVILLVLILITWSFPIIISFYTFNFWYIMLYLVWWLPSQILTILIMTIYDKI